MYIVTKFISHLTAEERQWFASLAKSYSVSLKISHGFALAMGMTKESALRAEEAVLAVLLRIYADRPDREPAAPEAPLNPMSKTLSHPRSSAAYNGKEPKSLSPESKSTGFQPPAAVEPGCEGTKSRGRGAVSGKTRAGGDSDLSLWDSRRREIVRDFVTDLPGMRFAVSLCALLPICGDFCGLDRVKESRDALEEIFSDSSLFTLKRIEEAIGEARMEKIQVGSLLDEPLREWLAGRFGIELPEKTHRKELVP